MPAFAALTHLMSCAGLSFICLARPMQSTKQQWRASLVCAVKTLRAPYATLQRPRPGKSSDL